MATASAMLVSAIVLIAGVRAIDAPQCTEPGLTAWRQLEPSSGYYGPAVGYSRLRARVVVVRAQYGEPSEVWEWDGAAFTRRDPPASLRASIVTAVAPDRNGMLVLVEGVTAIGAPVRTWLWDGRAWRSAAPLPPDHSGTLAYDEARAETVLFDARTGETWGFDGQSWSLRATAGPGPRDRPGLAFDPVRGELVLFGGYEHPIWHDDTWLWDGASWRRAAAGMPDAGGPTMCWNPGAGRVLLKAGQPARTWEWDGRQWQPTSAPPIDDTHGRMVLDEGRGVPVLVSPPRLAVREWDGTRWVAAESPQTPPPSEQRAAVAYDRARGRAVAVVADMSLPLETWEHDGSGWARVAPASAPPDRVGLAVAYHAPSGRTVLFGGRDATGAKDDTWEWDGTTWTARSRAVRPSPRWGHGMVEDLARGRVVLFGGVGTRGALLSDTWEWDGNLWHPMQPPQSPPATIGTTLTYDEARGVTVLFGLDEVWEWDGATWRNPRPSFRPPARFGPAAGWDPGRGRVVLLCGAITVPRGWCWWTFSHRDQWEWDGVRWTQSSITASPGARVYGSLFFHERAGRMLCFGGAWDSSSCEGQAMSPLGDTWAEEPVAAARVLAFGRGCGSARGRVALAASGLPRHGNAAFAIDVRGGPDRAGAMLFAAGPAALDLGLGCTWWLDSVVVNAPFRTDDIGHARLSLPVPYGLCDGPMFVQALLADPGGWQSALSFSAALELNIGR